MTGTLAIADKLSRTEASFPNGRSRALPRIWRSPYSRFGHDTGEADEETVTANAVYTDEVLAGIAASGFNAIWVHGLLHHLVPTEVFPEFGQSAAMHLEPMRALIERAANHGLRVYIYMQPPRGLREDDPFWAAHPDTMGSPMPWQESNGEYVTYRALCTSVPRVRQHLREAATRLARELEGLGGLILITASEYPSHCFRQQPTHCPRCASRGGADVITEVIQLIRDGVRSVSEELDLIVWNWSWSYIEADPSPSILSNLPEDVILMADFERGDSKEILGQVRVIDEYSLSFTGPSRRFMNCYAEAQEQGLPLIAKLQFGTTHELATVPNLPVIGTLYEKARRMRELGIEGFMGCWNFGNMITANTAAFNRFLNAGQLAPREAALEAFAARYFPGCEAATVRLAWEQFAVAMDSFPFSIPFIYFGPMNYTLAYPLHPAPLQESSAGRSWVNDARGDRLEQCLKPYSLEEVIEGLRQLSLAWRRGAELLAQGLEASSSRTARAERANAWVCAAVWRSTWNTFRVYKLRLDWRTEHLPEYLQIIQDEVENLRAVLPYVESDARFGYHSEAETYLFDAPRIRGKIEALQGQLALQGQEDIAALKSSKVIQSFTTKIPQRNPAETQLD